MHPPVIFVHGNGDSAALWQTAVWRFESNGYPRACLYAIDFRQPQARDDDARPQAGRSGTEDQRHELAAFVAAVRKGTGMERVALVAASRGANAVRNFIRNGGAGAVSHAVLAGGVNHGIYRSAAFNPGSEFNGMSPFMSMLNAPYPDGNETTPGVNWLTLRSDRSDKYAQPDGRYFGRPGMATGIDFDAPALRGATNVVLPGADHREVAFGPAAFAEMFRFITGRAPAQAAIVPEAPVVLDGMVSGFIDGAPVNLPLAGANVTVHQVATETGARLDLPPHRRVVGADGRWGPLAVPGGTALEFVIETDGHPVTHIYRSPFPRSCAFVHLRPAAPNFLDADDVSAGSAVVITRPRGYFGAGRDTFLIDGKVPPDVIAGVPCVANARLRLSAAPPRAIVTRFNNESITVRNWPAIEGHIVYAEFHY